MVTTDDNTTNYGATIENGAEEQDGLMKKQSTSNDNTDSISASRCLSAAIPMLLGAILIYYLVTYCIHYVFGGDADTSPSTTIYHHDTSPTVCTAYDGCQALEGDCCPTAAGTFLDCCESPL
mmetsp:Transcript_12821/g.35401  ORF Transcript_12821/g.35401 Transcript_12821/m.35401 type:complete len:122 (-) Transcript_12821:233-598(-)